MSGGQRRIRSAPALFLGVLLALWSNTGAVAEPFRETLTRLQAQLQQEPTNTAILFALGDLCHDEGVRENREAVKLAEKYFRQLLELDKHHARAMALLGSTLTMKARDAFWPKTQIDFVKQGNRTMDDAVQLAPQDPEVRFVRAINNFHMPKFLGRETVVQEDFAWLWKQVQDQPADFKVERKQEIALHYGLTLKKVKKTDDVREIWEQGLAFDPNTTVATRLREEIRKLTR